MPNRVKIAKNTTIHGSWGLGAAYAIPPRMRTRPNQVPRNLLSQSFSALSSPEARYFVLGVAVASLGFIGYQVYSKIMDFNKDGAISTAFYAGWKLCRGMADHPEYAELLDNYMDKITADTIRVSLGLPLDAPLDAVVAITETETNLLAFAPPF